MVWNAEVMMAGWNDGGRKNYIYGTTKHDI